jgi:proteasome lid subunit RPN8/RPN11
MSNTAAGTVRFRIDDRRHIELRRELRCFAPPLTILGVYHSHPSGLAYPSKTDIREAYYPDWIYVVIGLRGRPRIAAFEIADGTVRPARIVSDATPPKS